MRILYLCHRIPYPLNKGEKIRAFHHLKALATRHEVDLFTLADHPADLAGRATLEPYCSELAVCSLSRAAARLRALPYLATGTPLTIPFFRSSELQARVDIALRRHSYDRIFVYCSAMAQYVRGCRDIPIVTDLVDVDSDKWLQYASYTRFPWSAVYQREGRTLGRVEREIAGASACVIVTTDREADLLGRISSRANIHVLPMGVDLDYFKAPADAPARGPTISFTGDMGYFPNEEAACYFARQVLPLVRKAVPDARFLIVGRNPSRRVRGLRQMAGVEVTGSVPDVRPYLAMARVSVAPFTIAAGLQNKVLEAMAFGLPVVGTGRAVQGLTPLLAGIMQIGDGAEELADKVIGLLRDPELARSVGQESRRRVAADYSWEPVVQRLLKLVENPWERQAPEMDAALSRANGD